MSKPQPPSQRKSSALPSGQRQTSAFATVFAIDPRSLATFRILLGALLLVDLAIRAGDLGAMYSDDGMFSRAEICQRATTIWNWSFHFGSGAWGYQAMLFGLAAIPAVALLIGIETRLATIVSWLMLVSIHHRVPPILSGADNLLRMLLFWAMFLPLASAWSVDCRRRGRCAAGPIVSAASAAILLQMGFMYFFSAISKSNTDWFHGKAIAGSLAHDFYGAPAGVFLLQFPGLLKVITWGTLALEWSAPFLLFSPWNTARVRIALAALLAAMHLGIGLFLEVGLFSYVSLAGLSLFLPAEFWDSRWLARLRRHSAPGAAAVPGSRPRLPWPAQAFCVMALIFVFALNLNNLPGRPLAPLAPERWRPLTRGLGLAQHWGMFGAIPSKDGWCVAKAKLKDGSEVDLLRNGAPLDWRRPEFPARQYPNHFWQKIFREMAYDDEHGYQLMRLPVAEFLCRRWNARMPPEKKIVEFELIYCMLDDADPAGQIVREQLIHLDPDDT